MIKKLINRETIFYAISGVLTTLVNLAVFYIFCYFIGVNNLISNIIAWFIAVTFAYFMNARIVFLDSGNSRKDESIKIIKFFLARGLSLIVEEAGLLIFANLFGFNDMVVKAILAVVVIIMNYVLSKVFIFNQKE
ncbi:GtrA family protein [Anaerocolumna sp. AGMB13025]|uniref:GtrA family protein n=1 Tax=Anaerocolumna sp. AGMB13025 TaxID=3039116 RepID=UPI00241CE77C|nr:GtrA family protein [Anaerocolumna sp. AGMB13025]WFR55069.1 GtrA family protein [Anaerocolumna sp. AGMB13025]